MSGLTLGTPLWSNLKYLTAELWIYNHILYRQLRSPEVESLWPVAPPAGQSLYLPNTYINKIFALLTAVFYSLVVISSARDAPISRLVTGIRRFSAWSVTTINQSVRLTYSQSSATNFTWCLAWWFTSQTAGHQAILTNAMWVTRHPQTMLGKKIAEKNVTRKTVWLQPTWCWTACLRLHSPKTVNRLLGV